MDRQRVHGVFVPFTRGCSSSEELYGTLSTVGDARLPAGTGVRVGVREPPLFRRLVNRNNCVQKLRGTLIVTWQANRIDTPSPPPPPPPHAGSPQPVRPVRWLLSDFSPVDSTREIRAPCIAIMQREDAWSEKRITAAR